MELTTGRTDLSTWHVCLLLLVLAFSGCGRTEEMKAAEEYRERILAQCSDAGGVLVKRFGGGYVCVREFKQ